MYDYGPFSIRVSSSGRSFLSHMGKEKGFEESRKFFHPDYSTMIDSVEIPSLDKWGRPDYKTWIQIKVKM